MAALQPAALAAVSESGAPESLPRYELRVRRFALAQCLYEVWQLPATATPHLASPVRIAGLRGRNLELVEHRVVRRLARSGICLADGQGGGTRRYPLAEELALTVGLLFRALAPMRSREAMRAVTEGIEAMGREEAAYWLGMAMHRKRPRRVLSALRVMLTEPRRRKRETMSA